tara:strand:+ start:2690 stop:2890 length:201 start_codon:yes stop_codon:yes gene_type:complete
MKYICKVELEIEDNSDKNIEKLENSLSKVVGEWAEDNEICEDVNTHTLWCSNFYRPDYVIIKKRGA